MQSNSGQPVAYDAFRADFENGNGDSYILIGSERTNKFNGVMGRILNPGEKDEFSLSTSNTANVLFNNSSNGKIAFHLAVYNGHQIEGVFHSVLPNAYEHNGISAEIDTGQSQLLLFRDFPSVEKDVNLNFTRDYPTYADTSNSNNANQRPTLKQ